MDEAKKTNDVLLLRLLVLSRDLTKQRDETEIVKHRFMNEQKHTTIKIKRNSFSRRFQIRKKRSRREMSDVKALRANDFHPLLYSFVDENQFPWLEPSLHERYANRQKEKMNFFEKTFFIVER